LDHLVVTRVTDNREIKSERIEKMHEIVDYMFGYLIETWFNNDRYFGRVLVVEKAFGF